MADNFKENDDAKNKANKKGLKKIIIRLLLIILPIILFVVIFLCVICVAVLFVMNIINFTLGSIGSGVSFNSLDNNSKYWWPIGSVETTNDSSITYASGPPALTISNISSNFSMSRTINGVTRPHYGIDISSGGQIGVYNVIAAKDGVVYKVNTSCGDEGGYGNQCGGQLGNYVYIKHSDGSYTKYGHMASGSITVSTGDAVKQGQVIGKIGNSGSSTGAHLHFQLEIGGLGSSFAVNPLTYISEDNYRPIDQSTSSSSIIEMIQSWEGTGPMEGDYYIVYDDGYGNLTVGHGVTLKSHYNKFSKRGINISTVSKGSKILKSTVDDIEKEIINDMQNSIVNTLSKNNITLKENQIDALLMRMYNTGNISNFVSNYKKYGDTEELYDNYMKFPVTSNGKYSEGLVLRRELEWNLFHNGIYQMND